MKNHELSTDSNLLEYINDFENAGYVCKFANSKSGFILGNPHCELFCGLPDHALSIRKISKKTFTKTWHPKSQFECEKMRSVVISALSTKTPSYLQTFSYTIDENIKHITDLFLGSDHIFIENIFEHVREILIDIAVSHCYGESSKNNPEFMNSILQLLKEILTYGEKSINDLLKFRNSDYDKAKMILGDFVRKGEFQKINENNTNQRDCLVNFILQEKGKGSISDDIFYSAIPEYVYLFVVLNGNAISNFLIDISLDPQVFEKLEAEQRNIISENGKKITTECLDMMVYLDAAIIESIRLSNNKMSIRESTAAIFLPNGVLMPRNSIVQFNCLSHNRSNEIYRNHPHYYIPERHFSLGTKFDVTSKTNMVWGLGRVCPYQNFCARFIKLFGASFIRNYEISQGETNQAISHDGDSIPTGYWFKGVGEHFILSRISVRTTRMPFINRPVSSSFMYGE
ncbi:hypothetical protein BB560_001976 [Smittium megazygosporum]|uniref:Cytochrome P450 n=1 Tax=Smittium megazygosporum TaxID=133381 RepID=A0A2T9ZG05_9FUNG|nr:hypothetical protein BB560_001976 [Smittium megazygosporum]